MLKKSNYRDLTWKVFQTIVQGDEISIIAQRKTNQLSGFGLLQREDLQRYALHVYIVFCNLAHLLI